MHNIWEFYKVLVQVSFLRNNTKLDTLYKKLWICVTSWVAEKLKTYDIRTIGNIRKISNYNLSCYYIIRFTYIEIHIKYEISIIYVMLIKSMISFFEHWSCCYQCLLLMEFLYLLKLSKILLRISAKKQGIEVLLLFFTIDTGVFPQSAFTCSKLTKETLE